MSTAQQDTPAAHPFVSHSRLCPLSVQLCSMPCAPVLREFAGSSECADHSHCSNCSTFSRLDGIERSIQCMLADQGENNMPGRKGNSAADEGYSCSQRVLIEGWRAIWSKTPGL